MIRVTSSQSLTWRGENYRCAIGKSGISNNKREGDGTTPAGTFPLLRVLHRPDRVSQPTTELPVLELKSNDGWCNDPTHQSYNQPVTLPYAASHEKLWRADPIYDIIVIIGHNSAPAVPFRGSAIFLHVAKASFEPTEGCIAVDLMDLLEILRTCSKQTLIHVSSG